MLIKKTTRWFGDPCDGRDRAYKINRFVENLLWKTRIGRIWQRFQKFLSQRKHGEFLCRRRKESFRQWPGTDYWRKQGNDLCCSYCGSWHPEQFLAFCREVVSSPDINVRIEMSDKRYKIYATRPGIRNADYGAIKFYMHHAPLTEDGRLNDDDFVDTVNAAIDASHKKFAALMARKPYVHPASPVVN